MNGMIGCLLCVVMGCASPWAQPASNPAFAGAELDGGASAEYRGLAAPSATEFKAPEAPMEVPADVEAVARPDRQVIYSARLRLVVLSAIEALRSIQARAEQLGGYLQESDAASITVRVPADKFEGALAHFSTLGEVVDRMVKASDVTEQMLDLNIRLDNARKTRERLLEHLSKSTKVEDTLKIEAELSRVSGEIEQMEGRLRYLQSQIAMSTIRVEFEARAQTSLSASTGLGLPFGWLDRLGDGLVAGNVEGRPRKPGFFSRGPRFDPPQDFVRYYTSDELVEAMNAEGVRIKLQMQPNFDQGGLEFWTKLARRAIVEMRSIRVTDERVLRDDTALLAGERDVAGQPYGYCLVLCRTKDRVWTYEAWGRKAEFDPQVERILASARSLKR